MVVPKNLLVLKNSRTTHFCRIDFNQNDLTRLVQHYLPPLYTWKYMIMWIVYQSKNKNNFGIK